VKPTLTDIMRSAIEDNLKQVVYSALKDSAPELCHMMAYHMGWEGEGRGLDAQGKRIRPLLVTLSTAAAGGDWRKALPFATAVELIHNFSLIHDDIQDQSTTRRGRPTVWVKWGQALGINAGDTMFTIAHLAAINGDTWLSQDVRLRGVRIIDQVCVALTNGQYLDISYEKRRDLTEADYWPMVTGKTAALLAGCTELGALAAQVSEDRQKTFHSFGLALGLAFQVQDDWLGLWGDPQITGKSSASDLVAGKKTLPVLLGIQANGAFARRWAAGPIAAEEAEDLAETLKVEGVQVAVESTVEKLTREALTHLRVAVVENAASRALQEMAVQLIRRQN
jgi:geranylgeranyl diphosphate synthase type I